MTRIDTVDDLKYTKRVHAKCVPNPRWLCNEVYEQLSGTGGKFRIEMRHNVYNILSTEQIDLDKIRRPSIFF